MGDLASQVAELVTAKRFSDAEQLIEREQPSWPEKRDLLLRHLALGWTADEASRYRKERQAGVA